MKRYVTLLVLFLSFSFFAKAQFQFSSIPEIYMPGSGGDAHIHDVTCYSLSNAFFGDGNFDLYISTWWDNENGLYYQRSYKDVSGFNVIVDEGILPIPNMHIHGATILYKIDNSYLNNYTVAVVYSDHTGGYIGFYEWTTTGLSYISSFQLTSSSSIRMSIDGHRQYAYAVVWEEGDGEMYSMGGWVNSSSLPLVGASKRILCPVFSNQMGRRPDLAISHSPSNSGLRVNYTYIGPKYDEVAVSYLDFDSLFALPTSFVLNLEDTMKSFTFSLSPTDYRYPGFFYSFPKIDAPEHNVNYWAMVINDMYSVRINSYPFNVNKSSFIRSMHKSSSGIQQVILNDGSLSGTVSMTDSFNSAYIWESKPAVAYHKDSEELIHFAWGKTQDLDELETRDYIGMMFNPVLNDAVLSIGGDGYRIIDYNAEIETAVRCIALSGQNEQANRLFTVFSAKEMEINGEHLYYKMLNWDYIQDKGYQSPIVNDENNLPMDKLIINYYPNPVNNHFKIEINKKFEKDYFQLELYCIKGILLFRQYGYIEEINNALMSKIKQIPSAENIFLRLQSLSSKITETKFIVKD